MREIVILLRGLGYHFIDLGDDHTPPDLVCLKCQTKELPTLPGAGD